MDKELLNNLLEQIVKRFDNIDKKLDRMNKLKECPGIISFYTSSCVLGSKPRGAGACRHRCIR